MMKCELLPVYALGFPCASLINALVVELWSLHMECMALVVVSARVVTFDALGFPCASLINALVVELWSLHMECMALVVVSARVVTFVMQSMTVFIPMMMINLHYYILFNAQFTSIRVGFRGFQRFQLKPLCPGY